MNVEATVAKLETLETIIEILTDEYNEILDTVNGELEFLAGAIERGVIIPPKTAKNLLRVPHRPVDRKPIWVLLDLA